MVEYRPFKARVEGSSPSGVTMKKIQLVRIMEEQIVFDGNAEYSIVRRISINPKYRFYVQKKINNEVTNKYNIKFICKLKSIGT